MLARLSYVTTGEVTALEHKVRDDAMKGRTFIAEALLASAEGSEVLSSFGDHLIVKQELKAAGLFCVCEGQNRQITLTSSKGISKVIDSVGS